MASGVRSCSSISTSRCSGPGFHGHAHEPDWQPLSRTHFNTSRCPPSAALLHVAASHGQPCSRDHFKISRCPPAAAAEHVFASHAVPFARNHFSASRFPSAAASAHVTPKTVFCTTSAVITTVSSRDTKPLLGLLMSARDMNLAYPRPGRFALNVSSHSLTPILDPMRTDRAFIAASSSSSLFAAPSTVKL